MPQVNEISRAAALKAARSLAQKVAELSAATPAAEPSAVRVVEMPVQDVRPHSYELRVTERDKDGAIVSAILRPVQVIE